MTFPAWDVWSCGDTSSGGRISNYNQMYKVKSVAVYVVVESFGRFVQPDSVTEFTVAAGAHRKLWTGETHIRTFL